MSESNPIEAANAQMTAPPSEPADQHSTATTSHSDKTPASDSATTDSNPIKTTTNVYHTDSASEKPVETAEPAEPATTTSDKADATSSSRSDARSSYRPGSKALDLPPPVTSSGFKPSMSDSKPGPPLPVTTSASALARTSPPLPVTTSASDVLPVCPDPTAHRDTRLQEQASNAALYVTKTGKNTKQKEDILDANNKLSSRSKICMSSRLFSTALNIPRCRRFAQVCKPSRPPQLPCRRHRHNWFCPLGR
jgi:hypothetical protein